MWQRDSLAWNDSTIHPLILPLSSVLVVYRLKLRYEQMLAIHRGGMTTFSVIYSDGGGLAELPVPCPVRISNGNDTVSSSIKYDDDVLCSFVFDVTNSLTGCKQIEGFILAFDSSVVSTVDEVGC